MEKLTLADSDGTEKRYLLFNSYDFEVGKTENSFEISILRNEYVPIPYGSRIYIPDTEYGGIYRRTATNTAQDVINLGGLTWRGMMQKKIICPPAGQDYAVDSGELNSIVKARVETAFPGLFIGSEEDTGVTVSAFQYDRYCDMLSGLTKMLKANGHKLELSYSKKEKAVIVSAVPIVDYSLKVEMSSDMRTDYTMQTQKDGVNHLICLGKGELKDRQVYHWYADNDGNIDTTQHLFGADEIVEIFDYPGGELPDLIAAGRDRLESLMDANKFSMNIDADIEIGVGDIVGGRDYLSGMIMTSPIAGKICKWGNGSPNIEYKLEDEITVTVEPTAALAAMRAGEEA